MVDKLSSNQDFDYWHIPPSHPFWRDVKKAREDLESGTLCRGKLLSHVQQAPADALLGWLLFMIDRGLLDYDRAQSELGKRNIQVDLRAAVINHVPRKQIFKSASLLDLFR